ncbi:ABC transporter ATP-binding protein [uncultured Celeribacter sp.]|uniref:ABC transporter ATP-binding protein n=1 Tax=uncultured Celeribacter sp. TaxID=1303376 RepID=UPI003748CAD1
MRGVGKAERMEKAREAIALVGLRGVEDKYPKQLSGGMQQRVGLARALVVSTPIMLMDEPFGALDQQTRRYMQEELLHIWQHDQHSVVFVIHDMEEAILFADRVVLMSNRPGRIEEVLDINFERPRNPEEVERMPEFIELKEYLWNRLRQMHEMSAAYPVQPHCPGHVLCDCLGAGADHRHADGAVLMGQCRAEHLCEQLSVHPRPDLCADPLCNLRSFGCDPCERGGDLCDVHPHQHCRLACPHRAVRVGGSPMCCAA